MFTAKAAELTLTLAGNPTIWADRLASYAVPPAASPDLSVIVRTADNPPAPDGVLCGHNGNVQWLTLPDGRTAICGNSDKAGCTTGLWLFDHDCSRVEVVLNRSFHHPHLSLAEQEYMYVSQSFGNRLLATGGCVLHSSAIEVDGRGFAFAGRSGAGKSTHTALWQQALGDRCRVLNDDMPAVREQDGRLMLFGTPFSGTSRLHKNASAPLCAVIFVEQAADNRLERISGNDALFRLREALPLPYYAPTLAERGMSMLEAIAERVPLYRLRCTPDSRAFDAAYHTLMEETL